MGRGRNDRTQNLLNDVVKIALRFGMFAPHRLPRRVAILRFGRRRPFAVAMPIEHRTASPIDDVRLFLTTFAGGLLFMTIYLA